MQATLKEIATIAKSFIDDPVDLAFIAAIGFMVWKHIWKPREHND